MFTRIRIFWTLLKYFRKFVKEYHKQAAEFDFPEQKTLDLKPNMEYNTEHERFYN